MCNEPDRIRMASDYLLTALEAIDQMLMSGQAISESLLLVIESKGATIENSYR
jgi:hypothetical protein